MASKVGTNALKGHLLVAAITSVCSSGFLLFGYDQGVMSGVVISKYWLSQMGTPSTLMVGTITALYDVGAVFGAIGAAFAAEPLGRKWSLQIGTWILIIGTVLMGSCYERVQMMFARVITGIGIGAITSVTPVYQSEISAATQRGWQVCCQLTTMLFVRIHVHLKIGCLPRTGPDAGLLDQLRFLFPSRKHSVAIPTTIPIGIRSVYRRCHAFPSGYTPLADATRSFS